MIKYTTPNLGHFTQTVCICVAVLLALISFSAVETVLAEEPALPLQSIDEAQFSCHIEVATPRLSCEARPPNSFERVEFFTLENPHRLIVDLGGLRIRSPRVHTLLSSPIARRLRSGARESGARVVVDLKGPCSITQHLSSDKRSLVFDLVPLPGSTQPSTTSPKTAQSESENIDTEPATSTPSGVEPAADSASRSEFRPVAISLPRDALQPKNILKFSVDSTFVLLAPGDRPVKDITVINKTDRELFLRSDVQRVIDPGTPKEAYDKTTVVVATPKRFSLPPLGSRLVRVLLAEPGPTSGEDIYRLVLSPEQPSDGDSSVEGSVNNKPAVFKVIAGLGVTIAVPSATATGHLRVEPAVNRVVLTNTGDRVLILENCTACPLTKEQCTSSGSKILYPNQPWGIPVLGSGVINCEYSVGKEVQKISSFYGTKEPEK